MDLAFHHFFLRDRFRESIFGTWSGKSFVEWRPLSPRNPIHTEKPPANAIMQTFLLLLAMSEPSPLALVITGAISLGSLTIFLRHKLG
jgi:hypothetical protein